jgi:hypothetical protein
MSKHRLGRRRRRWTSALIVVGTLALGSSAAYAANAVIPDTELHGGGDTVWDPTTDTSACTSPHLTPANAQEGFTPVNDGQTTSPSRSDAFDDALILFVGNRVFFDADWGGTRHGQQLSVGPRNTGGLKVAETERALGTSPTLRVLDKFTNTNGHAVSRTVTIESNLGSDNATTIDASSSGDTTWTAADRWLVSHQEPFGALSDPVVTQVWYGKHAKRPTSVENTDSNVDCFLSRFRIRVPAHKIRYLMLFLEMNEDSVASAEGQAAKYDQRHLTPALRTGLSPKVRSRILNWDL